MKQFVTVSDVIDYLGQFDGAAEVTLMEEDKPVSSIAEGGEDGGFVCLETMMDQFLGMGGDDEVDYQSFGKAD